MTFGLRPLCELRVGHIVRNRGVARLDGKIEVFIKHSFHPQRVAGIAFDAAIEFLHCFDLHDKKDKKIITLYVDQAKFTITVFVCFIL